MAAQCYYKGSSIEIYSADTSSELELPILSSGISAGFPSPAMDFIDISIDLNRHLIKSPSTTFYGRVQGDSMLDAGIADGDLLVIDKSIAPKDGQIAICYIDGEFTVKRIRYQNNELWLDPENKKYQPIKVEENNQFIIWGIVIHVIKTFK